MSSETKFVQGITRDNATLLLAAAEEAGLHPSVVVVNHSEGGFDAPSEVVDAAGLGKAKKSTASKRTARTAKKATATTPKEDED